MAMESCCVMLEANTSDVYICIYVCMYVCMYVPY